MKLNMQKKMCWAMILMMGAWGCQGNTPQDRTADAPLDEIQSNANNSNCFTYQKDGDTIQVKMSETADGSIKGYMLFQLKEKDKNTGVFTGKKEGNMILADYSFQSEGVTSIRQIGLKQTDSTLTEGYGEIIQEGDRQRFKDPTQLDFKHSLTLKKTDCTDLHLPDTFEN